MTRIRADISMGEEKREEGRTRYRFEFYRTILNSSGTPFRCPVDSIHILRARSSDRALAAAKRHFERKHGVRAWDRLADGWTTEELPESETPEQ